MKKLSIFILSLFAISCINLTPYNPQQSFIFIKNKITVDICLDNVYQKTNTGQTGSAFVIKNNNNDSYILTAGHVCSSIKNKQILESKITSISSSLELIDFNYNILNSTKMKIINIDEKKDLCMIFIKDAKLPTIKISSSKPKFSDEVMTISAPYGFFEKNLVFFTKGYYLGQNKNFDFYSFWTLPGSSGSMILNKNKELVGITLKRSKINNMLSVSIAYKDLIDYINQYAK